MERNTRVVTLTHENCVQGETIANFLYRGFLRTGQTKEAVRRDVEAL